MGVALRRKLQSQFLARRVDVNSPNDLQAVRVGVQSQEDPD